MNGMADLDPGYDYRINIRGAYADLGDAAARGYPSSLGGTGEPFHPAGSGRRHSRSGESSRLARPQRGQSALVMCMRHASQSLHRGPHAQCQLSCQGVSLTVS